MRSYKTVLADEKEMGELRSIIEVYEELASVSMQKIRRDILSARQFYEGLIRLSIEVGSDFEAILSPQKKTAAVFISSNMGLYGDIIERTFAHFLDFIKKRRTDTYIIGRVGAEMMREYAPKFAFRMINLADEKIGQDEFGTLITSMASYREIAIFYGKYHNIAVQIPSQATLTGDILPKDEDASLTRKKQMIYLYEPSLGDVSEVFARQILALNLEEIVYESMLAKFASRLMHLDRSLLRIEERLFADAIEKRRAIHARADKKQKEMVAGVMARGI